jgi:hypothetical protein
MGRHAGQWTAWVQLGRPLQDRKTCTKAEKNEKKAARVTKRDSDSKMDSIYKLSDVTYPWAGSDLVVVASGAPSAAIALDDAIGADWSFSLKKHNTTDNKQMNEVNSNTHNSDMIFQTNINQ